MRIQSLEISTQKIITTSQNWLLYAIQLWGLILLTLHLAAAKLPEETAWSLWPYTFLPPWLGWLLALLVGLLAMPVMSSWLIERVRFTFHVSRFTLSSPPPRLPASSPASPRLLARFASPPRLLTSPPPRLIASPQLWFILIALLSGLLFWLARLRHLRWGDAYLLSKALSTPDLELRVIYNWQAPLTVFLHQRLWQFVADPLLGWPVEYVYATTSIICGMIFVYLTLTFTAQLGHSPVERMVLAGLIFSTGSMQLFFGYVENYTIIALSLMATLFLAWRTLRGDLQPVWPVLALSLTNAFHPSTVFLWPGMWLLSWLYWRRKRVSPVRVLGQTILPPLLIGGGVLALMESGGHGLAALLGQDRPGGGDGVWFVPLFKIDPEWQKYQPYTMFSAAHLLDWLNVHLLISPFGLPLLGMVGGAISRFRLSLFDQPADKDYGAFLTVTSAAYLLLAWLWNPDYGGRQDWDLFAPSAFVYTLLAGYLLVRVITDRGKLLHGGLFILAVSLLHTGAWIFTNTHELPRQ